MTAVPVSVLLAGDSRPDGDGVLDRLTGAGLTNAVYLAHLGVVTGLIDAERLADLESVPGVSAVEAQRRVRAVPIRPR